ncbi:MAG: hypothetical protein WAQ57_03160 [Candidatus Saccharimonadales bacterium]
MSDNPFETKLFQRLADDFAEAFWLDQAFGEEDSSPAVVDLHKICQEDGLHEDYILRARKAGALSLFTNGISPL